MQLVVKIDFGNTAFEGDNLEPELARILRGLADGVDNGEAVDPEYGLDVRVRDINGNVVGTARME